MLTAQAQHSLTAVTGIVQGLLHPPQQGDLDQPEDQGELSVTGGRSQLGREVEEGNLNRRHRTCKGPEAP